MPPLQILFITLLCAGLLSGCGLKGPLYIAEKKPKESPETEQAASTTTGTATEEVNDDKPRDENQKADSK